MLTCEVTSEALFPCAFLSSFEFFKFSFLPLSLVPLVYLSATVTSSCDPAWTWWCASGLHWIFWWRSLYPNLPTSNRLTQQKYHGLLSADSRQCKSDKSIEAYQRWTLLVLSSSDPSSTQWTHQCRNWSGLWVWLLLTRSGRPKSYWLVSLTTMRLPI